MELIWQMTRQRPPVQMHKAVLLIGHPLELAASPFGPGEPGTACGKGREEGRWARRVGKGAKR